MSVATIGPAGHLWRWSNGLLAAVVLVPLLVIFGAWLAPATEVWAHLAATSLPRLLGNTLMLMLGVAAGTGLLGVSLAWLVCACEFPGRRWLDWALMLPFALPTYVMAFVFLGLMDFQGPAQGALRFLFGLPEAWSFEVRHAAGVICVMALVLYPYVYMLARSAFLRQGVAALEAARTLGMTHRQSFVRVALPMARPAIIAGISLAVMEALADFGAVAVFNYDTFTTAIYKAWFGFFDLRAASQLASMLLAFVVLLVFLERWGRSRARYDSHGATLSKRHRLRGMAAAAASGYCGLVLLLAFVAPMLQLLVWTGRWLDDINPGFLLMAGRTLALGAMAAAVTVAGAFVMAYALHRQPGAWTRVSVRVATLGYALPGSVLAVAVMLSLTWLDRQAAAVWAWLTGAELGWVLAGGVGGLLLTYFARFLALAFNPIDAALEQVRPSLREAAQSLRLSGFALVRQLYAPILRPGLLTAALLVLVDVMKEMPATLLLRPFGWDTLAVRIYGLSSEGLWERAALPAVMLVAVGLIPVLLLAVRGRN